MKSYDFRRRVEAGQDHFPEPRLTRREYCECERQIVCGVCGKLLPKVREPEVAPLSPDGRYQGE